MPSGADRANPSVATLADPHGLTVEVDGGADMLGHQPQQFRAPGVHRHAGGRVQVGIQAVEVAEFGAVEAQHDEWLCPGAMARVALQMLWAGDLLREGDTRREVLSRAAVRSADAREARATRRRRSDRGRPSSAPPAPSDRTRWTVTPSR